ncbi:MAG: hypothetical protein D6679_04205 [Candidatus Hydrogenedentota bacterium]|nr:MAG: hypothetical protein D6679_04205 [Candidatus Hydrogenedentota bacterium]
MLESTQSDTIVIMAPELNVLSVTQDVMQGTVDLINNYGIGTLVPDTILLGETENPESFIAFSRIIRKAHRNQRNVIIMRESLETVPTGSAGRIDVWWGRKKNNAGLMLALAWLLSTSPEWEGATLELKTIIRGAEDPTDARESLEEMVRNTRINARVSVVTHTEGEVFETIGKASRGARLVFLGLGEPAPDATDEDYSAYYESLLCKTNGFPPTAFVLASEKIDFKRIFR